MDKEPIKPRLYVVVRRDLSETYRMVQGAHGVAQFALEHPEAFKEWNNEFICFLSVFNGLAIDALEEELKLSEMEYSKFIEPDLGDKVTSLVLFEDGSGIVKEALKKLPLA